MIAYDRFRSMGFGKWFSVSKLMAFRGIKAVPVISFYKSNRNHSVWEQPFLLKVCYDFFYWSCITATTWSWMFPGLWKELGWNLKRLSPMRRQSMYQNDDLIVPGRHCAQSHFNFHAKAVISERCNWNIFAYDLTVLNRTETIWEPLRPGAARTVSNAEL